MNEVPSLPSQAAPTDDERAAAFQARWELDLQNPELAPLHRQMGLRMVRLRPTTILSMELSPEVQGFYPGSVHGGILAAFADVTSATALWDSFDPDTIPTTAEMHIRFYRQPKQGPLTAEALVVHVGSRLLSTECGVRDAQDSVLIRTSGTSVGFHRKGVTRLAGRVEAMEWTRVRRAGLARGPWAVNAGARSGRQRPRDRGAIWSSRQFRR